jgi:uncharacterized Fe-S radical SAM superfamily protein PflX
MKQMEKEEGSHMVLSSFIECCRIPLICWLTHLLEENKLVNKNFLLIAFDILEVHQA